MTFAGPNPSEGAAWDASKPPPAPLHYSPRIWENDQGTFYVVADGHYWAARATMIRHRGRPAGR